MSWITEPFSIYGAHWLTQSQQENNATEFATFGSQEGWSIMSMAGMLGCIWAESWGINPGAENTAEPAATRGLGLCQWTGVRHTNLINWCTAQGYNDWWFGPPQMTFLRHEIQTFTFHMYDRHAQAIVPPQFRFTDGEDMARCADPAWTLEMSLAWWLDCFEMGGGAYSDELWNQWWSTRWPAAQRWYEFLSGQPWPGRRLPPWLFRAIMDQSNKRHRQPYKRRRMVL